MNDFEQIKATVLTQDFLPRKEPLPFSLVVIPPFQNSECDGQLFTESTLPLLLGLYSTSNLSETAINCPPCFILNYQHLWKHVDMELSSQTPGQLTKPIARFIEKLLLGKYSVICFENGIVPFIKLLGDKMTEECIQSIVLINPRGATSAYFARLTRPLSQKPTTIITSPDVETPFITPHLQVLFPQNNVINWDVPSAQVFQRNIFNPSQPSDSISNLQVQTLRNSLGWVVRKPDTEQREDGDDDTVLPHSTSINVLNFTMQKKDAEVRRQYVGVTREMMQKLYHVS